MTGDLPRQLVRTRRFSLGVPERFTVPADGRRHQVLLLPGASHKVTQEDMAANLLHLQFDFLKDALER